MTRPTKGNLLLPLAWLLLLAPLDDAAAALAAASRDATPSEPPLTDEAEDELTMEDAPLVAAWTAAPAAEGMGSSSPPFEPWLGATLSSSPVSMGSLAASGCSAEPRVCLPLLFRVAAAAE